MLEFWRKKRENVFWILRDSVDQGNKIELLATTKAHLKLVAMNSNRKTSA